MARRNIKVITHHHEPDKMIDLCDLIIAEHEAQQPSSPITHVDMVELKEKVLDGKSKRAQSKDLRRQSEHLMAEADTILGIEQGQTSYTEGTVYNSLIKIRDLLLALHKGDEEALGDWGFEVVISTSTPGEPEEPQNPEA
ncbi:MAG: hypothetical protein H8E57_08000 [Candidatus Cloacimonetes bacterium]|nr:hypothetical protein [Candidatus Cloacimonadota bacterium]